MTADMINGLKTTIEIQEAAIERLQTERRSEMHALAAALLSRLITIHGLTLREEAVARALVAETMATEKSIEDEFFYDPRTGRVAGGDTPSALRRVAEAATFLVERLNEFDPDHHQAARDYCGHIVPALERLELALANLAQEERS